jgi:hypothetical protein
LTALPFLNHELSSTITLLVSATSNCSVCSHLAQLGMLHLWTLDFLTLNYTDTSNVTINMCSHLGCSPIYLNGWLHSRKKKIHSLRAPEKANLHTAVPSFVMTPTYCFMWYEIAT